MCQLYNFYYSCMLLLNFLKCIVIGLFFFLLLCMPGNFLLMIDILNFMLLSAGSCCSPLMSIGFCSRLQLSFL